MIELPDLDEGERVRGDCPTCGGRGTFTVSNLSGSIVYNCYKAGCHFSGKKEILASSNFLLKIFEKEKNLSAAAFDKDKDKFTFPDHWSVFFPARMNRYILKNNIDADKVQLYHDVRMDRAVFPIGTEDAVGRALGRSPKKWHRYSNSGLPFVVPNGDPVYVVEDAASACAVSKYGTGFALLGTNLTDKLLDILKEYPHIVVCLDRDASMKAIQMKLRLSQFTKAEVRLLDVDPKENPEGVLG
tara:strand:+ start:266 stop:994 length:729 start_codon:yes stop_codon:yes gene_type:complete